MKVKWGILSTSKIGREKVIPAMQKGECCDVVAIASRNIESAQKEAKELNIPKAHDSYQELLNDKEIDAVYIPLPNDMHVEWAIKCLEANKHVLCEKPIGLTSQQAQKLADAAKQKPHLKIMEAFMYHFHPQWLYAKKLVDDKIIGDVKTIQSFFSFYNVDPDNIRNKIEAGGGAMLDIGCYCISIARFIFGKEPTKVFGLVELDPELRIDRKASGILDFTDTTSTFTCSTQLFPYQRVNIVGTEGRIEIDIPFNPSPDQQTEIRHYSKAGPGKIIFDPIDQYIIQGDIFSKCILDDRPVPFGLEDAVNNMKVIEGIFKSSEEGKWITIK